MTASCSVDSCFFAGMFKNEAEARAAFAKCH